MQVSQFAAQTNSLSIRLTSAVGAIRIEPSATRRGAVLRVFGRRVEDLLVDAGIAVVVQRTRAGSAFSIAELTD